MSDWSVFALAIACMWMIAGWVVLSNPYPTRSRASVFMMLGIMPLLAMVWAADKVWKWLFEPRY